MRELRFRCWHRARLEGVHFTGIEPDKVTMLAKIDIYAGVSGKRDGEHRLAAFRAEPAARTFAAEGVQPKRIDAFGREGAAQ